MKPWISVLPVIGRPGWYTARVVSGPRIWYETTRATAAEARAAAEAWIAQAG